MKGNVILLTILGKLVNLLPDFVEIHIIDFYFKHQKQPQKVFYKKTFFN